MGNSCSPGCRLWCLLWRLLCCPFFPLDVLDGIWDLIESVSEGFLTYFCISELLCLCCVEILKNLPVHSFNALIIPIFRDCLSNYF